MYKTYKQHLNAPKAKVTDATLNQEFFRIFRRPIHISVSSICVQVWDTKGRMPTDTASFKQVELLQFFSS